MSYDKLNKDIEPSKELLKENQVWKYCASGWRKCPILSEEQKLEKQTKMKEIGQKGRKQQSELLQKGKQADESITSIEKSYQEKISKLEKEIEKQEDIKTLISEMKSLRQATEKPIVEKAITENQQHETPKQEKNIQEKPTPKNEAQRSPLGEQEQVEPQPMKRVSKNPFLNKMML